MWEFCGKTQFLDSFWPFTRNYVETVLFPKTSTPGNLVKLRYFSQCVGIDVSQVWIISNSKIYSVLTSVITQRLLWRKKSKSLFIIYYEDDRDGNHESLLQICSGHIGPIFDLYIFGSEISYYFNETMSLKCTFRKKLSFGVCFFESPLLFIFETILLFFFFYLIKKIAMKDFKTFANFNVAFSLWRLNAFLPNTAWNVFVFGVFLVRIFPYSEQMRKNTDQKNSEYRLFSRSVMLSFNCPWKHHKTNYFLMFSGRIEKKHFKEMGEILTNKYSGLLKNKCS